MKKKLAILLVGTMIASSILAGCGSKKSEPTKKETSGELVKNLDVRLGMPMIIF